ncbi:MAG: low-complexity tail membrane protein [Cyanobacteria bacterium P01_G01_bin.38]
MIALRQEPYLWLHLTGLAVVPLLLDICLAGLATADPVLPVGLEMALLSLVGTLPILWMQWQRPFYIFSLGLVALEPAALTPTQRQILSLMRSQWVRAATVGGAGLLVLILWQLYRMAPLAATTTPFAGVGRPGGLGIAAIAFLAANLFTQVPIMVLRVLLANPRGVQWDDQTVPVYPTDRVKSDFWAVGFWVKRILPELQASVPDPVLQPEATAEVSHPEPQVPAMSLDHSRYDETPSPYEEVEPQDFWD